MQDRGRMSECVCYVCECEGWLVWALLQNAIQLVFIQSSSHEVPQGPGVGVGCSPRDPILRRAYTPGQKRS